MRATTLILCVAALAGCTQRSVSRPAEPASRPAPSVVEQPTWLLPNDLTLATATTGERLPMKNVTIYLGRQALAVGMPNQVVTPLPPLDRRATDGFGAGLASGDAKMVWPLHAALWEVPCEGSGKPPPPVVFLDFSTPYRMVTELLSTLHWSGYPAANLVVQTQTHSGERRLAGLLLAREDTAPAPLVVIRTQGFDIDLSNGNWVGRECSPGSNDSGPAIASRPGAPNYAALRACLRRAAPGLRVVRLAAEDHFPFSTVANAIEVLTYDYGYAAARVRLVPWSEHIRDRKRTTVSQATVTNAAQVVAGMREPFRNCYLQQLAVDPKSGGRIQLTIKVRADGSVQTVSVTANGNLGNAVACVQSVAQAARFEPPDGGGAVVNVPITFVRTDKPACRES